MSDHPELRGHLDRIGYGAGRELRRVRTVEALLRSAGRELVFLPAIPAAIALVQLGRWAFGAEAPGYSFLWVLLLTLGIGAVLLLFRAGRAFGSPSDPRDALAVADRVLGSEDRLLTAFEFLELKDKTPFMEAALLDAEEFSERNRGQDVRLATPTPHPGVRAAAAVAAGVAWIMLAVWLGNLEPRVSAGAPDSEIARVDPPAIAPSAAKEEVSDPLEPPQIEAPQSEVRAVIHEREKTAEVLERSAEISEGTKPSEGKTGSGRSADAEKRKRRQ